MPGITNPAEPFFKDGTWGWDGSVWRKLPIVWGYSGNLLELDSDTNTPASSVTLSIGPVDADEVWLVKSLSYRSRDEAQGYVRAYILIDALVYYVYERKVILADAFYSVQCDWYLPPGGFLKVLFPANTAGKRVYCWAQGYRMKIEE